MHSKFDYTRFGILLFPFVLPLPIPMNIKSLALILFAFTLFLNSFKNKVDLKNLIADKIVILFLLLFLLDPILSLIHNKNIYFREYRISFLFLPTLFLINKDLLSLYKHQILRVYVVGVLCYLFYTLIYVIYFYSINPEEFALDYFLKYVTYHFLPYAIHHTYFGIYVCFASAIVIFDKKIYKKLKIILISMFFFSIFILGSKFSILFFVIILPIFISINLNYSRLRITSILSFILLVGASIVGFFYLKTDLFRTLVLSTKNRVTLYECSIGYIKDNYLIGIGNENVKAYIERCNKGIGRMDTHNIFLQEFLSNGILGIGILILLLIFFFKAFLKNKKMLGILLIIMLISFGMVEHLLNTQNGVLFIVFFLMIFYFTTNKAINKVIQ